MSRSVQLIRAAVLGSLLLCLIVTPSTATTLTMYGGLGGHANGDSTNDGSLAVIDQTTGAVTVIGHPSGVARLSGLTFDLSGNLFGVTQGAFPFPPVTPPSDSHLVQINSSTGALISNIGAVTDANVAINIADLATQPGTGNLYGVRGPNDGGNGQGLLYTINKTTGAATLIGDTSSFFDSIAFAPDGTLYLIAADLDFSNGNIINPRLETLNPANAGLLTTVGLSQYYGAFGIRPTDGVLFAGNGDQAQLFTLDPVTGAQTLVGGTGRTFVGDIAFQMPEPGSLSLAFLGAVGLAFYRTRRARQRG
jgi:hypothetical protein